MKQANFKRTQQNYLQFKINTSQIQYFIDRELIFLDKQNTSKQVFLADEYSRS